MSSHAHAGGLTDGGDVAVREHVIGEAQQQAALAGGAVADQEELVKIIVLSIRRSHDDRP